MEKSYNHLEAEKNWYDKWVKNNLFLADNESKNLPFSMVLPPPNVTGSLHMGHALTFTIPDIIARRKKMLGFNVLWLPGIDHAGIATQMVVENHLKVTRNQTKDDLGREKFLDFVWKWKTKSEKKIIQQINKLGLSLDWSRMRFTLSDALSRVVIKVFVHLYKEKKIYQGTYMVNRCPSCQTVLSDLEVNHHQVEGRLTYIRYPSVADREKAIVVATTRPETMLGDTAVAVNPRDKRYREWIGKELMLPLANRKIKVIADESVDMEFGTGAVKVTPAHDPQDFKTGLKHKLEQVTVIDGNGNMIGKIPDRYKGLDRFTCREKLVEDLKKQGLVEKEETHIHNVGHCQRCDSIVEPDISTQWFLKTAEIAKPAIAAVEENRIVFIPDKWKKVYFNWMFNIQDWCISRQLWWGHRIPAYYCLDCNHTMVEEERPEVCEKCGSKRIHQDEDVLDTWFSSALWPISTLGWQDDSLDFRTFYPTSLMATGFDIIFFWVARMIMMGIHFAGDIPFREVLINGLIRDEKGQKMSKTRDNVIDPLDIIQVYGADALRFTLAVQAVPGMDISLSTGRIKGYKAFANKIWNAARYVILNLKGDEESDIDFSQGTDTDKWILHALNKTVEKVNELMDNYRIYEAADLLYHFFWHEYCDWYLEFSKGDLQNIPTRNVLRYTLNICLKLLHPFMPFITEEIYQKMDNNKGFLLQSPFPTFNNRLVFIEAFNRIELLKGIVSETRKARTENRIDPGKSIPVLLKTSSEKEKQIIPEYLKYFNLLTRSSRTEIVDDFSPVLKGFRAVTGRWEILLPFEKETDRQKELGRLKREYEKLVKRIEDFESKLAEPSFLGKAPDKVIQDIKLRLQESIEKKYRLQKTIGDLS